MKTKQEKMQVLERLVKEGHITLCEAFDLSETEKEYVYVPQQNPITWFPTNPEPWIQPYYYGTITVSADKEKIDIPAFQGTTNL